ncbi:GGDEF domain-containing protein [Thiobacillus sedimenti]|uniref:diguanylate cyclase n=1 Tax=Thiobacillus sedimenti TaxID=3110231 RepID=A0ABZ1CHT0_9PROT|nr:GGDEF domain-containing protein [Thiobacillus sp. SCUT-2]WRS38456.1 GGDEF domain-containing protein [Thiobacillus sp. SCUT-2]
MIDLHALRLDDARALLEHAGQDGEREAGESAAAYLQRMIDGLCELSLRDPLTGLGNRRHFLATLERAIEVVARSGESILLLLLDIDHFKQINDTHGHLAGDQVLQAVAACLAHCVRPMDTVVRYGGEEFAMILPNCRPTCGRTVAERVRRAVESLSIAVTPLVTLKVTISIGGAYAPEWVRSTTDLWIERADMQLYRAKADGRNQAFLDLPHEISVSAEEKGLLFSHFAGDAAPTDEAADPAIQPRVNA